jgi:uncharacterized YccA/Bax inhibitor family protein
MSRQMLNESTFTSENLRGLTAARAEPQPMTIPGTIVKAFLLIALTLAFAAVGWNAAADILVQSGLWFFIGYVLLLGLSVGAAANPRLALPAGLLYAVLMGLWMGAISRVYESYYDGIVGQALLATVAVFAACLLLYSLRAVRVTGRFVQVVMGATLGIGILYLFGWLFSLFGIDLLFWTDPGNSVGIVISVVICLIAALNLFVDFAFIEGGTRAGAPKEMEWYSSFGLLTTLVWLYVEVLRLLARIRTQ